MSVTIGHRVDVPFLLCLIINFPSSVKSGKWQAVLGSVSALQVGAFVILQDPVSFAPLSLMKVVTARVVMALQEAALPGVSMAEEAGGG